MQLTIFVYAAPRRVQISHRLHKRPLAAKVWERANHWNHCGESGFSEPVFAEAVHS